MKGKIKIGTLGRKSRARQGLCGNGHRRGRRLSSRLIVRRVQFDDGIAIWRGLDEDVIDDGANFEGLRRHRHRRRASATCGDNLFTEFVHDMAGRWDEAEGRLEAAGWSAPESQE